MSTPHPISQSTSERRAAEAELRRLIAKFAQAHQPLVGTLRRWLKKRLPTAHEVVYEYRDAFVISYSPNAHGYEGVFAVRGSSEGVKLYFNRGAELADPAGLLQGSGKQTRLIPVERASTLTRPEVAGLADEAIALNAVPFATTGRGPLVIRSVSKNKPRPRAAAVSSATTKPARSQTKERRQRKRSNSKTE